MLHSSTIWHVTIRQPSHRAKTNANFLEESHSKLTGFFINVITSFESMGFTFFNLTITTFVGLPAVIARGDLSGNRDA